VVATAATVGDPLVAEAVVVKVITPETAEEWDEDPDELPAEVGLEEPALVDEEDWAEAVEAVEAEPAEELAWMLELMAELVLATMLELLSPPALLLVQDPLSLMLW
jgi:hypothetical protein